MVNLVLRDVLRREERRLSHVEWLYDEGQVGYDAWRLQQERVWKLVREIDRIEFDAASPKYSAAELEAAGQMAFGFTEVIRA